MVAVWLGNRYWLFILCSLVELIAAFSGFGGLDQLLRSTNEIVLGSERHPKDFLEEDENYNGNSSGIINSNKIYEWTPISTNISAGGRDVFVFSVNTKSSGLQIIQTFETLIFLSGNICKQPADTTDKVLRISYSFNETIAQNSSLGDFANFDGGYLQALATSPLDKSDNNSSPMYSYLYVVVEPVNSTTSEILSSSTNDTWYYKLSVSENDLVYQWDSRTWLKLLDTDHNSALFTTDYSVSVSSFVGDDTSDKTEINATFTEYSLYDLYLYSEEESNKIATTLNISLCAVTNGSYLATSANVDSSLDTINKNYLDYDQLAIFKSHSNRSSVQEQFYITGLNSSTNYTVYLTKKLGRSGNVSDVGGVLFSKSSFTTRDTDSCSLIFDLDFCAGVAYSVPSSLVETANKTQLASTYDDFARSLYSNFSKVLQNVPCAEEADAKYSPLRTCEHCANSYRNWLCGVTIPRCGSTESRYFLHRDKNQNRNSFLNEVIQPVSSYYEILPCIEMCYAIVRDCPSVFQFACPDPQNYQQLLLHSYNFYDQEADSIQCNFVGNDTEMFTNLYSSS